MTQQWPVQFPASFMSQRVRAIQCFALLSHMQHPESAACETAEQSTE